jgi:putative component of membrane protein insertase Oxa1/YidC/SpoIIIJ protein YidD
MIETMKKYITHLLMSVFIFLMSSSFLKAQNLLEDRDLLMKKSIVQTEKVKTKQTSKRSWLLKYNPISLVLYGSLTFYQKVVSSQLATGCLYETSCSRFSRKALNEFGLVKGVFLTADRLSRCNRVSATTIHPIRIQPSGKVYDEVHLYRVKHNHTHQ